MLTNKKFALVTGATSGIGYEIAKLLAADNYSLVIVGRNIDTLSKVASEFKTINPIQVVTIEKDLFNKTSAKELYDIVKAKEITIDILVNNAGQGEYGAFVTTDLKREIDIIQLNVIAVVTLCKLFLIDMVERKEGKILNLSSVASKVPGPLHSVYHGTKAFIQSFTEAINNEVKDSGVTITALLPGATDTDFFRKASMLRAKNVVENTLADAKEVAKAGYEALLRGDDKVIAGFQNKIEVAMNTLLPDNIGAEKMHKHQAPVDGNEANTKNHN